MNLIVKREKNGTWLLNRGDTQRLCVNLSEFVPFTGSFYYAGIVAIAPDLCTFYDFSLWQYGGRQLLVFQCKPLNMLQRMFACATQETA